MKGSSNSSLAVLLFCGSSQRHEDKKFRKEWSSVLSKIRVLRSVMFIELCE
jgi:hypothetical protein